jgi:transposase InsO family protein
LPAADRSVAYRSPTQLARDHQISRSWIYQLLERFEAGGYEALEPRSRRPRSCSRQAAPELQAEVLRLRTELVEAGHDGGPQTILHYLAERVEALPSASTVWRILKRHGLITPQPHKRPRSSFIRFEARLPNETWQVDATAWHLGDGRQLEILNFLDDHSRLLLASRAFITVRAGDVVHSFHSAAPGVQPAGLPAQRQRRRLHRTLAPGQGAAGARARTPGVEHKHSSSYHPQTCGKVERLHQTLKRFLAKQPPAASLADLQLQLDAFRAHYNHRRPHRALDRQTPATSGYPTFLDCYLGRVQMGMGCDQRVQPKGHGAVLWGGGREGNRDD